MGKNRPVYIDTLENDQFVLEIYACHSCNGHLGIDESYLDQVMEPTENMKIPCPYCGTLLLLPNSNEISTLKARNNDKTNS